VPLVSLDSLETPVYQAVLVPLGYVVNRASVEQMERLELPV